MNARLVKLTFTSPFHLSPPGESLERTETAISSDMLISALAVCHTKLYGTFCEEFFSEKLLVSSLFPFYKDILFFPAPLFDYQSKNAPPSDLKKLRKIKYLDFSLWSKLIRGEPLDPTDVETIGMFGVPRIQKENENKIETFLHEEDLQRLGKDPFYFSQIRMNPEAGMFFVFQVDPFIESQFKACLRLLADEGIGGDRTVGKGMFTISGESTITIPHVQSSHIMNLSFFIPSQDDIKHIDLNNSFYRLHQKRGWYITHRFLNLKKRGIFGFSEGSVFSTTSPSLPLTGKTAVLLKKEEIPSPASPPFDIFRHGFFFGVPVKIPEVSND